MDKVHGSASTAALAVPAILVCALLLTGTNHHSTTTALLPPAALASIVLAWWLHRRERRHTEQLLRAQEVERAVMAERLALARELHDITSNGLSMITLRASSATFGDTGEPTALADALRDVEQISRTTTQELRSLLHTLRDHQPPASTHTTPADLTALVEQARATGMDITTAGLDTPLESPAAALTIHRALQEALGNTHRHAGPARATVTLTRTHDTVHLTVTDDGPTTGWAASPGSGLGLIGLGERISMLGGTMEAGRHDAGFTLEVTIPDAEVRHG